VSGEKELTAQEYTVEAGRSIVSSIKTASSLAIQKSSEKNVALVNKITVYF